MHANTFALFCAATTSVASTLTIDKRAPCTSYTIIYTRGILAPQDEWKPVEMMNSQITGKMPGAKLYNTVYPAAPDLDPSVGTADILNKIQVTLQSNPSECFFLEGYSLGAMATINALPKLSGASSAAVKGVFLFGNPYRKAGLACNVDDTGGTTTRDVNGERVSQGSIPDNWVSKCLDVCIAGDRICDLRDPFKSDPDPHVKYPHDAACQNLGAQFAINKLQAG